jgi:ligand-binding SRPBCC domain-containing protein
VDHYTIEREQWVPRPLAEVFEFFSNARNLELLTPAWLKFHVLTAPAEIASGVHIRYRLLWHGIPLHWTTRITCWNPPHDFEDLQLSGPYKLWRHTHGFRSCNGGTQMTDRVAYALPFGLLGRLAHALQVRRNVAEIFDYRYQQIEKMFGASGQTS